MDRSGHQAMVHRPPDDLLERFEIDPFETTLPRDEWPDPVLVSEPYIVEFPEPDQLDPARASGDETDEKGPPAPLPRTALPSVGMAGSLAVHLLPLVLLVVGWTTVPQAASAVPVQLVFEQPEPEQLATGEQPPAEAEAKAEQPSETTPPPQAAAPPPPDPAPAPPTPPQKTPPPKTAAVRHAAVRPKPVTPPKPPPDPVPPPRPTPAAAPAPPRQPPAPRQLASAAPHPEAAAAAPAPGPEESNEAYFSYLVTLTRKHLDLLPMSVLAGRHGKTVIAVRVLDDGTIAETRIAGSSNYPDIDARIQQMVVAVGRFPPLPPSLQGRNAELDLKLSFPDALR